jgi:hypothetical protein
MLEASLSSAGSAKWTVREGRAEPVVVDGVGEVVWCVEEADEEVGEVVVEWRCRRKGFSRASLERVEVVDEVVEEDEEVEERVARLAAVFLREENMASAVGA